MSKKNKRFMPKVSLFLIFLAFSLAGQHKEICLTFDDFPYVQIDRYPKNHIMENLKSFIHVLKKYDAKPAAFINELKLYANPQMIDQRKMEYLTLWLDAGFDIGNHTFSHKDLSTYPVDVFKKDIIDGERIHIPLLKKKIKYFRYPQLEAGYNVEMRKEVEQFLKNNGYIIAPGTINNAEYRFAQAYSKAYFSKNEKLKRRIANDYIKYMKQYMELPEEQSRLLFGKQIKHIMLLHMNELNMDEIERLCKLIKSKNYKFISIAEALSDPAYQTKTTYYGRDGISFLEEVAFTKRVSGYREFDEDRVKVPQYIIDLSEDDYYHMPNTGKLNDSGTK